MHLSDGTLRRWIDEPFALDGARRRHLEACPRCQRRAAGIRSHSDLVTALLAAPAAPPGDTQATLGRLRAQIPEPDRPGARHTGAGWRSDPRRRARVARWSAAAAGATAAAAALVGAGVAQGFITIFQPEQIAPVAGTSADLASLQELGSYGQVGGIPHLTLTPVTRAQAQSLTGVTVPSLSTLPAGIPSTPTYDVVSGGTVTFTFDSAKAAAAAQRAGATLPPMPAELDGSTLQLTLPSVLIESYGVDISQLLGDSRQGGDTALTPGASSSGTAPAASGGLSATPGGAASELSLQGLVIVASRLPEVTSTGATAAEIEDYLLSQPGIPADLASEIHAIGDPATTLPVPVPVSLASATQVSIGGAPGLLIGDQTGLGSLVLWQHDGVIRAVVGSLSSDEVMRVADSIG